MLTYAIPHDLQIPLYEYIYRCIKEDILSGRLLDGEKLPSKRTLASNLSVSIITIENAYHQLLIEGYIKAIEKKGYYVNKIEIPVKNLALVEEISEDHSEKEVLDLQRNAVAAKSFPIDTWAKLSRKILLEKREEIFVSADKLGYLPLRKAISKHLHDFSSLNVSYDQIIIGSGSEHLYELLMLLLGKDKTYAIEDPGHQGIHRVYEANGVKHHFIPLDDQGIDITKLNKSKAEVVHISPAHHFPTGITTTISRRYELLNWAKNNDAYIIEDDYDNEFRLKGKPIAPLYSFDSDDRVIYMNTFSKTISPSFRISYMVLPKGLRDQYLKKLGFLSCTVSTFDQMVLSEFIDKGYFERHLNRMRNHYRDLRDALIKELKSRSLYKDINIKQSDSGLHFLMEYPYEIKDEEILQRANAIGLRIAPLSRYYHDKKDTRTLVINYSGLDIAGIKQTVDYLEVILEH